MKKASINLFIFSLILLFNCCKKEIIVEKEIEKIVIKEIEKEYSWKRFLNFNGLTGIALNSYASHNNLFFSLINGWYWYDTALVKQKGSLINYGFSNLSYKPPITENIFLLRNETNIIINSSTNHTSSPLCIELNSLDSNAYRIYSCHDKTIAAISDSNYCYIPVIGKQSQLKIFIIRPTVYNDYTGLHIEPRIDKTIIRKLTINNQNWVSINTANCFFNHYFISYNNVAVKIDTLGNLDTIINAPIYNFLKKSDTLIAISRNYNSNFSDTYLSLDHGATWTKSFPIFSNIDSIGFYSELPFSVINNNFIAYTNNKLFHVYLQNQQYNIKPLKNDGLDDLYITSVTYFNKKVFLTGLSGIYYKEWKNLFIN